MRSARRNLVLCSWIALPSALYMGLTPIVWPLIAFAMIGTWVIYVVAVPHHCTTARTVSRARLWNRAAWAFERRGKCRYRRQRSRRIGVGSCLLPIPRSSREACSQTQDFKRTTCYRVGPLRISSGTCTAIVEIPSNWKSSMAVAKVRRFKRRPRRTHSRFATVPFLAEASPTRDDFLAAISIFNIPAFIAVGGTIGYFASQAVLPAGPLWAQVLIAFNHPRSRQVSCQEISMRATLPGRSFGDLDRETGRAHERQ